MQNDDARAVLTWLSRTAHAEAAVIERRGVLGDDALFAQSTPTYAFEPQSGYNLA